VHQVKLRLSRLSQAVWWLLLVLLLLMLLLMRPLQLFSSQQLTLVSWWCLALHFSANRGSHLQPTNWVKVIRVEMLQQHCEVSRLTSFGLGLV
jgi:hypothetical protein